MKGIEHIKSIIDRHWPDGRYVLRGIDPSTGKIQSQTPCSTFFEAQQAYREAKSSGSKLDYRLWDSKAKKYTNDWRVRQILIQTQYICKEVSCCHISKEKN